MDFTILQRGGIAVGGIISLVILSLLYEWARRELTTVKIGPGKLNKSYLKEVIIYFTTEEYIDSITSQNLEIDQVY